MSAEFQLALMETALRALSLAALATAGVTSLAYFLIGLAQIKRS